MGGTCPLSSRLELSGDVLGKRDICEVYVTAIVSSGLRRGRKDQVKLLEVSLVWCQKFLRDLELVKLWYFLLMKILCWLKI